jgi:hypothetical protein
MGRAPLGALREGARLPLLRGALGGPLRGPRLDARRLPPGAAGLGGRAERGPPARAPPLARRLHGAQGAGGGGERRGPGEGGGGGGRGARGGLPRRGRGPGAGGEAAQGRALRGDGDSVQLPETRRAARVRRGQPGAALLPEGPRGEVRLPARDPGGPHRLRGAPAHAGLHRVPVGRAGSVPAGADAGGPAGEERPGPGRAARGDGGRAVPRGRDARGRLPVEERAGLARTPCRPSSGGRWRRAACRARTARRRSPCG